MEKIKLSEFLDKCRCCFNEITSEAKDIDDNIISKISDIFAIELSISPKLSIKICNECYLKIIDIYQYKHRFINNQNDLNIALENFNDDEDDNANDCEIIYQEDDEVELGKTKIEEDEICFDCDKKFPDKKKLKMHRAVAHKIEVDKGKENSDLRICPDCGKILKGNNHLNFHIKTKHLKLKKYTCDKCGWSSYGKFELRNHILIQHLPLELRKQYPCDECDSVLTTKMSLKTHKLHKHSGLRPHSCFLCNKSYALKETLKSHIRNVHNMERKFKCIKCNKGFNSRGRLNDHFSNAHGKKQEIPCTECGKIFNSLRNLHTHRIYHSPPKLKCQYCDKLFYVQKNLKEHQESNHLGVTYLCEICHRSFQSTSGLRRHMRSHEFSSQKVIKIPIVEN